MSEVAGTGASGNSARSVYVGCDDAGRVQVAILSNHGHFLSTAFFTAAQAREIATNLRDEADIVEALTVEVTA